MAGTSTEYALALREAAKIIATMEEEVYWVGDGIGNKPSQLSIRWHFYSRAEAENFRDRMVGEFHPTWIRTEQPDQWGIITMGLPAFPAVSVEIGFYEQTKK